MVDIKEAQNLTYKNSRWTQRVRKKIDKKIKKAAKHGVASTFIYVPLFRGGIQIFLSIVDEYKNIGYKVQEYCTKENSEEITFWGVWLSWEK